jgi:hypothetical protein
MSADETDSPENLPISPPMIPGTEALQYLAVTGDVAETLKRFGKQPLAFTLGLFLNYILGGAEDVLVSLLDAIWFLFVGDSAGSTDGHWGVEDVALYPMELVVGAGDTIGSGIIEKVGMVTESMVSIALQFGVLAPVVLAFEIAIVLVVFWLGLRTLVRVALDIIPGLGGILP